MYKAIAAWKAWQKRMKIGDVYAALRTAERLTTKKNGAFTIFGVEKNEHGILLRVCCAGHRGFTIVLYIYILAGADGLIGGTEFLTASLSDGSRLADIQSRQNLYQSLLNFGEELNLLTQDTIVSDLGDYIGC